jgi:UDP-N-acetylglucosamine 1-carboxyvinyltransferase
VTEYIEIIGGASLNGEVQVSGAKNAVLPLLLASLLTSERCEFTNVPNLDDVNLVVQILEYFGGQVTHKKNHVSVAVPRLVAEEASYSLVKALRASFWVLAPLLARGRAARVALPGGDIIGARPVDIHLAGLEQMGADIKVKHGVVYATALGGLKPATIDLRFPSVGATHQLLMAAALTPGTTVLHGVAREPEVVALAQMLTQMGSDIEGAGSDTIIIRGREQLGGATVNIIGDRIEAGTYLIAGAVLGGKLKVSGIDPNFFGDFTNILEAMGTSIEKGENSLTVAPKGRLKAVNAKTGPFPQLATDLQPLLMTAMCLAEGESTLEEGVYEARFRHASELIRMGAQIQIDGRVAKIHGVEALSGAPVEAHDIRAGAALVIAGLAAQGMTQIHDPQHIRRGYENLEDKLRKVGARIGAKLSDPEDYMFTGC